MNDPKNDGPSVSLTIMIVSLGLLIGAGIGQLLGKFDSVGPFVEIYVTNAMLYYGRRANFNFGKFSINNNTAASEEVVEGDKG